MRSGDAFIPFGNSHHGALVRVAVVGNVIDTGMFEDVGQYFWENLASSCSDGHELFERRYGPVASRFVIVRGRKVLRFSAWLLSVRADDTAMETYSPVPPIFCWRHDPWRISLSSFVASPDCRWIGVSLLFASYGKRLFHCAVGLTSALVRLNETIAFSRSVPFVFSHSPPRANLTWENCTRLLITTVS